MGIYDESAALAANNRGQRACMLGAFALTLPPADRADLVRALADGNVSSTAILAVIKKRGYIGRSDTLIKQHRSWRMQCAACSEREWNGPEEKAIDRDDPRRRATGRGRRAASVPRWPPGQARAR